MKVIYKNKMKLIRAIAVLNVVTANCFAAAQWNPEGAPIDESCPIYRYPSRHINSFYYTIDSNTAAYMSNWREPDIAFYAHLTSSNYPAYAKTQEILRMRFATAVAESSFAEAYSMLPDTEHGGLAKRFVVAEAKKSIKQLIGASVFNTDANKKDAALTIINAFPDCPAKADLNSFINVEEAQAVATLRNLTPDAAARTAALRSIADQLFS